MPSLISPLTISETKTFLECLEAIENVNLKQIKSWREMLLNPLYKDIATLHIKNYEKEIINLKFIHKKMILSNMLFIEK